MRKILTVSRSFSIVVSPLEIVKPVSGSILVCIVQLSLVSTEFQAFIEFLLYFEFNLICHLFRSVRIISKEFEHFFQQIHNNF